MQVVLFVSFFAAEAAASIALFHINPLNPICIWYTNAWTYAMGHFIMSLLVLLVIALLWWIFGNLAAWESICRTRQRGAVLFRAGLAGLGIDLVSSILARAYTSSIGVGPQGSLIPWLLLRAGLWAAVYFAVGAGFIRLLRMKLKSRRLSPASPK